MDVSHWIDRKYLLQTSELINRYCNGWGTVFELELRNKRNKWWNGTYDATAAAGKIGINMLRVNRVICEYVAEIGTQGKKFAEILA